MSVVAQSNAHKRTNSKKIYLTNVWRHFNGFESGEQKSACFYLSFLYRPVKLF